VTTELKHAAHVRDRLVWLDKVLQNLGHEYEVEAVIGKWQRRCPELDLMRFQAAITASADRYVRDVAAHHTRTC
jgi:hypothetical protein